MINPPRVGELRAELISWLDVHAEEIAPPYRGSGSLAEQMIQLNRVKRLLWDAGYMGWGWPERVGGRGGPAALRAVVGEEIVERDLLVSGFFSMTETLAPTLIGFASEELAAEFVPRLLSGEEMWSQGFSEPGTGSDLASLACRARRDGETWVINGQKVWTSLSQYSTRCLLLTRTGTPESRHRGITAFFVDLDTPGITVRPLSIMSGSDEFAEVFFDDVVVPDARRVGEIDGGWAVAMALLPFERSTAFWHRTAFLQSRLQTVVAAAPDDDHSAVLLGEAFAQLHALRCRSRATVRRFDDGATLGPETSVDKVLVASVEQRIFDVARELDPLAVALPDGPDGDRRRDEYLYSRAASIYGGTGEIQRNIIARRLLDLGDE
ncbi:MAG: acyl-CoA dehydrogenase family protein [Acidimicrobiales bacterium]|nr:acyl-CoA dehydrogenase family protein [Acidimicrobiales bacterium]